jgi:hypothetical protein
MTPWGEIWARAVERQPVGAAQVLASDPPGLGRRPTPRPQRAPPEEGAVLYLPAWTRETTAHLVYAALSEFDVVPGVVEPDMDRATGDTLYIYGGIWHDRVVAACGLGARIFDRAANESGAALTGDCEGKLLAW